MATTITRDDVIAIAAELSGTALSDAQWTVVLMMTSEEIYVPNWPSQAKADIAARYLAAHKAVKIIQGNTPGGGASVAAGTLSSVTVGSVTKAYMKDQLSLTANAFQRELMTTAYGREYLRLASLYGRRLALT